MNLWRNFRACWRVILLTGPIVSARSILLISILVKTSNPRVGENISRLTNIQLGEPDPALFRVPADYKIQEECE